MNFSCSNIAWTKDFDEYILSSLLEYGVTGVEIAPTVIWPDWHDASVKNAATYLYKLKSYGLLASAMQSIFFGKKFTSIFDKSNQGLILSHLAIVAKLAGALEIKTVVFGAPKLRYFDGACFFDAIDVTYDFFLKAADLFYEQNSCLCIEPCHQSYGCNFITNSYEAMALVKMINHNGLGLHIDSSALYESDEKIEDIWGLIKDHIRHFHISEPKLSNFINPVTPVLHNLLWLKEHSYQGWCSVEMLDSNIEFKNRGPWEILNSLNNKYKIDP